jgi:hypothetical protein
MSSTISLSPSPPTMPSMAAGDDDTRFYDLSAELGPLGDSIASVQSINISHQDGTPSEIGDLALDSTQGRVPLLSAGNQRITVWLNAGVNAQNYVLVFTVLTVKGSVLARSAYLSVVANLG